MAKRHKPVDTAADAAFPDTDPTPDPEVAAVEDAPMPAPPVHEPTPTEICLKDADEIFALQAANQAVSPGEVNRVFRTAIALLRAGVPPV